MADEATVVASVEIPAPAATTEPIETTQINGDMAMPKDTEEAVEKREVAEAVARDGADAAEIAEEPVPTSIHGTYTPNSKWKDNRKSAGGVPEHKKSKNKRKSMPTLHLDCQPGDFYWARLKGYPPWPAVICDEQMLPESLLATRPVSTTRPDGTLRDDFKDGGKNAKERTFPIMFLFTNEFQWMANTQLTPLDPEECKKPTNAKMSKALQSAYQVASEGHDLDYFKGLLKQWQEEQAQIEKDLAELAEKEAKAEEDRIKQAAEKAQEDADGKSKKKGKPRKSKSGGEDVEMEDADAPKSSKKRKKDAESDAEGVKPKKTPKVTKLNAPKTPNGEGSTIKKSASKSKKKLVIAPKDQGEDEKPRMTEAEKLAQREKAVLYLRHRMQKGFLSRDQAPQEAEMANMGDFFTQLEAYENLEPSIIRTTKIHKVLKAIVKLSTIPKEEDYNFKKRSAAMLEIWNKRMEVDGDAAKETPATETKPEEEAPEANGAAKMEEQTPLADVTSENAENAEEMKAGKAAEELDAKVEVAVPEEEKKDASLPPSAPIVAADLVPPTDAMDTRADDEGPKSSEVEGSAVDGA